MRRLNLLYLAAFLMQAGASAGATGAPLMAKIGFGASLWDLAIMGMASTLAYTVGCLAVGVTNARRRPFAMMIAGTAFMAVSYACGLWATRVSHLVLLFTCSGLGNAAYWPMLETALSEGADGQRLNRRMGLFNVSWSLGDAAGTVAGGALYDVWAKLPFVLLIVTMGFLGAAVLTARRRAVDANEPLPERFAKNGMHAGGGELNARFRNASWVANFIGSGTVNVLRSVFAAPAKDVFGMRGTAFGLVIGTFNAMRTLTFVGLREWPNWHYRTRILMAFNGLLALGMAGVVAAAFLPHGAGVGLVFVSFAAAGVGFGLTYYSSIFYSVNAETPASSKPHLHEAVLGAGGAVAVVAAGIVNQLSAAAAGGAASTTWNTAVSLSPLAMCAATVVAGMGASAILIRGRAKNLEVRHEMQYPKGKG